MKGKILVFGGVAALLYLVSRAKSIKETVRFLEYTPGRIDLKFEGLVPVLHVKLNIYNPNRTSVPLSGVLGQINFKGRPVASFTNTTSVNINGNESTSVDMKLRLSLFNTVVALFTKEPQKVIEVDGLLKTPVTDIPFGYSYDFTTNRAMKRAPAVSGCKKQRPRFIDAFRLNVLKQTA